MPCGRTGAHPPGVKMGMRGTFAAGVVLLSACGASSPTGGPVGVTSPAPTATSEPTAAAEEGLPQRGLPGARGGSPGEYGWTGRLGSGSEDWVGRPNSGMHWVTGDEGDPSSFREAAAMFFANEESCFGSRDAATVPVMVAGYDGAYLEPYEPPIAFNNVGDEITRAYELNVGSGKLCVYVTWHPTTTPEELASTLAILDTLLAEQRGDGSILINFTLTEIWDTG